MDQRLYRSVQDRVISGVCGGLGDRFGVDPSLVRLVWVVLAFVTGIFPMLLVYVVMAMVLPELPSAARPFAPPPPPGPIPGATPEHPYGPPPPDYARPPSPASMQHPPPARSATPAPAQRGDRNSVLLIGAVLLGLGVAFLLREMLRVDWDVVWPLLLVGFGGWLVFRATRPA